MANLDRIEVIDLLGRLGAENDETVLQAARELNRKIGESGMTWDSLLRLDHENDSAASDADHESIEEPREPAPETDGELSAADKADAARLIDRLITHKSVSDSLRQDLAEIKRTIADGTFDAMDARYIRALAKRLGV